MGFIAGLMIGGTIGVITMCCLQINRSDEWKVKEETPDETE